MLRALNRPRAARTEMTGAPITEYVRGGAVTASSTSGSMPSSAPATASAAAEP